MKHIILILIGLLILNGLKAQSVYFKTEHIPFYDEYNNELKNAWAGGIQSAQISHLDANNDGNKDLVIFDKESLRFLVYINENNSYRYNHNYSELFPTCYVFAIFKDFNCDGKNDLFTYNIGAAGNLKVYKNITQSTDDFVKFELYKQNVDMDIVIQMNDLPAIDDIDSDGDLDVLAFNSLSYISYYKNKQVELSLPCDTMVYDVETYCWGDIKENELDNSIILNDNCGGNKPFEPNTNDKHPGGSSLLSIDLDNDTDKELFIGVYNSPITTLLTNGGTASDAHITSTTKTFPDTNNSIYLRQFVFLNNIDVDFDGLNDIVATVGESGAATICNFNNTHFYKNIATNQNPQFSFVKKNFLTDSSIDVGVMSKIAVFDKDNDLDFDLLISSYGYKNDVDVSEEKKLMLVENIGTQNNPSFKILDRDYLKIDTFGITLPIPTFTDIDSDGDDDLFLGDSNGKIWFFENTKASGILPDNFQFVTNNYQGISVGVDAAPCFIDFDNDTDQDLFIGKGGGTISYFENIGTASIANFQQRTDSVGKIYLRKFNNLSGSASPYLCYLDSNNIIDLVVGSKLGEIYIYLNIEGKTDSILQPETNTFYNQINKNFSPLFPDKYSHPVVVDLNNDNKKDIISGNIRGGIMYFVNQTGVQSGIKENELANRINVYPNPTRNSIEIQSFERLRGNTIIRLMDRFGRLIKEFETNNFGNSYTISLSGKSSGIYYVQVILPEGNLITKKVVKL